MRRIVFACLLLAAAHAHAALTVTPLTWNVVGLDSNSPAAGPKHFPVGARVCTDVAATNVRADIVWESANAHIALRPGSQSTIALGSLAAGTCADAYFEIEVNPVAAAYDTARRYRIVATADGPLTASTPARREVYVEHLVSQSRNGITGASLDGIPVPKGGTMNLVVGNTYTIDLFGSTATQGYNQFEAFLNFPNTIFRILSVSTTYSANSTVPPNLIPNPSDRLYGDACRWENDTASPNYRSCVGGDAKVGGTVATRYVVQVVSGGGTAQPLSGLLYDFSGSSYHYNADFSASTWIAAISNPASLTFAKSFSPSPAVAGATTTLRFTIGNPGASAVSGIAFTDPLPALSGGPMVVASPATFSTSGCGSPTFAPTAGASSISFSGGTIAGNGTCVVTVQVAVPASPTTGTYINASGSLFAAGQDTGRFATANLDLTSGATGAAVCGLLLAEWTMPVSAGTTVPPAFSFKAANVATATAAAGAGITTVIDTVIGNPVNSWNGVGFSTAAALNTANNDYFEFAATTTGYTGISFRFDARLDRNLHGPNALQLFYSTDGTNFTAYGSPIAPGNTYVTYEPAFTGPGNAAGITYFRVYGYDAGNPGADADLFLDNVAITGCATPQPPTITKAFLADPVAVGGTSTLRFTLTNPNSAPLTGVKFSDVLPAGLRVAVTPAAATTCAGSPSWSPAAGATALDFGATTGATLAASGSCTVSVDVTATTAGAHANVSGFVSATESGANTGSSGFATATLTAIVPPVIAKSFGTNPVVTNGASQLTFTIVNPNPDVALAGVAFADTYPAGLVNTGPASPLVANTCGGTVTAAPDANGTSLAGGALAAGASCTIAVTVTSAAAGTYANTTGVVSATTAGGGNSASATLTVDAPIASIGLLKEVSASPSGPWVKFLAVAPGTSLHYRFTAENTGNVALNPFGVTDPALAGTAADPAGCTWTTINVPSTLPTLPVASATIDPIATCVVGPVVAVAGEHPNTAIAHGTFGASVIDSEPATATYLGALPGFSLLKQIGPSASGPWTSALEASPGASVHYRFTLTNVGALPLDTISVTDTLLAAEVAGCVFADPLPAGSATFCVVGPVSVSGGGGATTTNVATGHASSGGAPVATPTSSASYTIMLGSADLAITKSNGATTITSGGATTYTITVTNSGPIEVTGAAVNDTAPAGLAFGSWTCAVGAAGSGGSVTTACGASSGSGDIATTVTLKVGGSVVFTVPATLTGAVGSTVTNTANVTAPPGVIDPDTANNSASDADSVVAAPVPDMRVTLTGFPATAAPGAVVTGQMTCTNSGTGAASGATCTVTSGGTATNCTVGGSPVTLPLASLAAGASIVCDVNGTAPPSGSLTINAATGASNDTGTTGKTASHVVTVTSPPVPVSDLAMTKSNGTTTITAGGTTTYTITVSNNGPDEVAGAAVTDTAPAGLTIGSWTCAVGATGSGGSVTTACGAGSGTGNIATTVTLKVGGSVVFTVPATVTAAVGSTVTNTASVAPPAGVTDPNSANNSATDVDTVVAAPAPDMRVMLTGFPPTAAPGAIVNGQMTCTNTGSGTASGATCTVTSGGTATGCTVAGSPVTLPLASLAPGAAIVCDVSATAPPSGSLTINAAAGASNDTGTSGKTSSQVVTVSSGPPPGPGATQPIPTLSEWALMLLSLLLAGAGAAHAQRRRGAASRTSMR